MVASTQNAVLTHQPNGGEDGEDTRIRQFWMPGKELCVTRGRSHVFTELMHMRSQLRRSTRHFLEFKESDGEGQNRYVMYRTRVVREIRSLRGNAKCSNYRIRPSTQGSRECPKHMLVMYQGKLGDKE